VRRKHGEKGVSFRTQGTGGKNRRANSSTGAASHREAGLVSRKEHGMVGGEQAGSFIQNVPSAIYAEKRQPEGINAFRNKAREMGSSLVHPVKLYGGANTLERKKDRIALREEVSN